MKILRWITLLTLIYIVASLERHGDVLRSVKELIGQERYMKIHDAKHKLIDWFLKQRKNDSLIGKWGPELPRIAIALSLGNETFFEPGNSLGDELRYELIIELLPKLTGMKSMNIQDLALYITALRMVYLNTADFFGHNLEDNLRSKMLKNEATTNPFAVLARCTGWSEANKMESFDFYRLLNFFNKEHRVFWTDLQSVSIMALQCITRSHPHRGEIPRVRDRQKYLADKQFQNGTIDNPISTALLVQAFMNDITSVENFNLSAAFDVILQNQKEDGSWGSIRDSYFVLPVLNFRNYLFTDTYEYVENRWKWHQLDQKPSENEPEDVDDEFIVYYTLMFEENFDQARTWRIMVSSNNTFYDVIETVNKLDTKHNVKYRIINGKPDISSLYGKKDDIEYGKYWFIYIRPSLLKNETPVLIKKSPVEIKVKPNEELILWYREAEWIGNPPKIAF